MAKRRIGALISVARDTGMDDYIETGIPLNAKISSQLLINILFRIHRFMMEQLLLKETKLHRQQVTCHFQIARSYPKNLERVTGLHLGLVK